MNTLDQFMGFAFCMIRPAVAMSIVPFGNDGGLGVALRVPLVLMFAMLPAHAGLPADLLGASFMEALIGLAQGLAMSVVFFVAGAAGGILDQQGGYTVAAVYDPNFQQESALFETLFTQFAALTFFTGTGLVMLCGFFADAWSFWPPGGPYGEGVARLYQSLAQVRLPALFVQGLQLAAPLLGLMVLTDLSLGLAARHAKRLNPFSTARSIKAMVLSFAAAACVPALLGHLADLFAHSLVLR
ncbi:flagellar biosynthetic protein FliR [Caballeronia sp. LZ065]|uniref:EscT/YscT/HrcT family type III secretion system export apparatus protein n=1 Tax=Caballeronia sp. LZ065 TaxID=3038571 RepID=UPI00285D6CC0|nr:flagellar biosynthetic protein FliR [Caballeronia sp. LZ065]MDR5782055.1 flagellar biosynthetic protein FliR [Caballeronia sp. LZ065]